MVTMTRRTFVAGTCVAAASISFPISTTRAQSGGVFYKGANISGAEFGGKAKPRVNFDYFYPDKQDIDFFLTRGFNFIRIPFRWERIQRRLDAPVGAGESKRDLDMLLKSVELVRSRGAICLLDMHNYGRRNDEDGKPQLVGSADIPVDAFIDFWRQIGTRFAGQSDVWLGLMNEPHDIAADEWASIAQQCVSALRRANIPNKLLVPGTAWTGAHSWVSSGNAKAFDDFNDPANNFAFEVHQYFDKDSSGRSGICVAGSAAARLKPFQDWCRARPGRLGFLGEFAFGDPNVAGQEACAKEMASLSAQMSQNRDIWLGWSAWGGGRRWSNTYPFRLQVPGDNVGVNAYMQLLMSAG